MTTRWPGVAWLPSQLDTCSGSVEPPAAPVAFWASSTSAQAITTPAATAPQRVQPGAAAVRRRIHAIRSAVVAPTAQQQSSARTA